MNKTNEKKRYDQVINIMLQNEFLYIACREIHSLKKRNEVKDINSKLYLIFMMIKNQFLYKGREIVSVSHMQLFNRSY